MFECASLEWSAQQEDRACSVATSMCGVFTMGHMCRVRDAARYRVEQRDRMRSGGRGSRDCHKGECNSFWPPTVSTTTVSTSRR
eukprot:7103385-Prymnesium_polylepis.1